jgi:WD40 repeat protein
LAYAPDGKTLAGAISSGAAIHFCDATTGAKRKQEVSCGPDEVHRLAWSPDSKKLAWVGQKGIIHLWDVDKGEEIGQWKGHDKNIGGVAFAPDGKTLATGGLDQTIRLWDVATHEEKRTLDGKHQHVGTVVFSHDGRILASSHGDGTIALWDPNTEKVIRRWQAHAFTPGSLQFAPDDKTLVSGAYWECGPQLWDVETGEEVRPFAGHTSAVERVMFSPEGKRILSLGREKKMLDWDVASGREAARSQLSFHAARRTIDSYTLSPRGDMAASWGHDDETIRLWDVVTGKERHTLGKFDKSDKGSFIAPLEFSPDGRLLAFGTKDGVVSVWDTAAGVERQRLKGLAGKVLCVAFSPDGQKIAAGTAPAGGSATIGLWDVTIGKSLVKFSSTERVDNLALSSGGKMLASASRVDDSPGSLRLWNVTTGHELRPQVAVPALYALAFSPDGKWLAGGGADKDQKVHVWEVSSGLEARLFPGSHGGGVLSVAFAPDGRTLASGGGDSSILLWDLTGRMKDGRLQAAKWTRPELEQRWRDLANTDGKRAVQALWDLVADPEQAVPLLRQRIKPAPAADAKRVEQLIRDLDSEDFETRTKATEELEKLVESVEPVLRKKLADKPSLEVRQRIKQVLSKLEPSSPERLRELRAIQVLEYAGTAKTKACLRTWAKDAAFTRLTREAEAALERLAKK